jgi:hypothetical protein
MPSPPAGSSRCRRPRFSVRIESRTPVATTANERWDIDNLIKPTLDAMEGVFGARPWRGTPQPADVRVDHIDTRKWDTGHREQPGAHIDVWVRD